MKQLFKRLRKAFRLWVKHNGNNTKYLGFKKCLEDAGDFIDDLH